MTRDPDRTRTHHPAPASDPALDAGLAAAFGPDSTPGGWSRPPLLRDEPSDNAPLVQPSSPEALRAAADRYHLFGEIARGGMGVILKGRDPDLGREVAVKVLKAELAGKVAAEERFVEEAQVGGQLQHPGVVPVYDLGRFADGRPYFAMKYVKGRTLADLLAERAGPAADRGKFLHIFLKVCETVAYAHARGVIHRDIKPSNVMVANYGEVLVMDWGLAKVLTRGGIADEAKATQLRKPAAEPPYEPTVIHTARFGSIGSDTLAGSVMGTPAFMPPEQAGGEIEKLDERTDVFGLGAVLCVILTGEPPYVGGDADTIRLKAIRGDLEETFARLESCGSDRVLIELCRRCLAPKREDRPRHAGEVESMVSAYLADVEARAHRAEVERAAAEARTIEERKTRHVAEEKALEERRRRRLQAVAGLAFTALIVTGGSLTWWVLHLRTTRAAELARERDQTEFIVKDAIDDANRALDEGRWIDAAASIKRGEDRLGEGDSFPDLRAVVRQARADREMALALERAHGAAYDMTEDQRRSATGYVDVAAVRRAFEGYGFPAWDMDAEAVRDRLQASRNSRLLTEELVALSRKYRPDSKDLIFPQLNETMRRLDDDPYRQKLAAARDRRDTAAVLALAEDPALRSQSAVTVARVIGYLREKDQPVSLAAFANLRLARQAHPTDVLLHANLEYLLFSKGSPEDLGEALGYAQIAVALRPQSSLVYADLGFLLSRAGDVDGVIAALRRAVELDPKSASAHINLGYWLLDKKDLAGAEAEFREAIRLDPNYAIAHRNLGKVLLDKKDLAGAETEYREAIRLDPNYAAYHNYLGKALDDKKDVAGAEAEFREAVHLDPKYASAHNNLGKVLLDKKDFAGAEAALREAIRLDPNHARAHSNLGRLLLVAKNDLAGAEAEYREAIRLHPKFAVAHNNLGHLLSAKKDLAGAEAEFREAIRLDPNYANAHNNLGMVHLERKELDAAEAEFRAAIRSDSSQPKSHFNLARVLSQKKDFEGAEAEYRAVLSIDATHLLAQIGLQRALQEKGDAASLREALRMDPRNKITLSKLAWLLATGPDGIRNGKQAVEFATKACELAEWKNANHIDALAAAHAEDGDFDKALEYLKKAQAIPGAEEQYGPELRERLSLYARKQPYRDPKFTPRELGPPPREVKR